MFSFNNNYNVPNNLRRDVNNQNEANQIFFPNFSINNFNKNTIYFNSDDIFSCSLIKEKFINRYENEKINNNDKGKKIGFKNREMQQEYLIKNKNLNDFFSKKNNNTNFDNLENFLKKNNLNDYIFNNSYYKEN